MHIHLVYTSDLAARKIEVGKVDINKIDNVANRLNNLKTKVYDADVSKLKLIMQTKKKISDVGDNEFVKNTKFNTLRTKKLF